MLKFRFLLIKELRYGMVCVKLYALVAQSVEHHHGKVGVTGSNPVGG